MDIPTVVILTVLILATALLYASVGHAGASGYLAVMAVMGLAPSIMKPTALVLNILVAAIATFKFYRANCFSWAIFWPFAITSIPFAFIGGAIMLPNNIYKFIVGLILLYAAYRLYRATKIVPPVTSRPIPLGLGLLSGSGIGLLSGLTGTGGGIFLSPLLIFMGWAETRQTSGVSAAFILANSLAGLLGQLVSLAYLPNALPLWLFAAAIGGWVGADYGSRRLASTDLRRLLALVLVIAALKLMLS
jgi:uncharacterized membrane protein YfcA